MQKFELTLDFHHHPGVEVAAAGDPQVGSRDEGGARGEEKAHGRGHLVGVAEPLGRQVLRGKED